MDDPQYLRMPTPETREVRATIENLGAAKPRIDKCHEGEPGYEWMRCMPPSLEEIRKRIVDEQLRLMAYTLIVVIVAIVISIGLVMMIGGVTKWLS